MIHHQLPTDDFIGNAAAAVAETFLLSNPDEHPSLVNGKYGGRCAVFIS